MDKDLRALMIESVPNAEAAVGLIERLFEVARAETVFGEPVTKDGATVITAAEVRVGMGLGFGGGGGEGPVGEEGEKGEGEGSGFGSGGGGGGGAGGRPIAAIIIEEGEVRIEPIIDATKVALAFFTTIGTIFAIGAKIRRQARRFEQTA